jgi:hypothetical protein
MNNKSIGSAMAGSTMGATERERHPSDFYATPKDISLALLLNRNWQPPLHSIIWECAVGDGAMKEIQEEAGYRVIGTDISTGTDFLEQSDQMSPVIMTNPPFNLASEFIRKGHELKTEYMALLLKMTFWSAANRYDLFQQCKPVAVLPLTWRMDCTGQGRPTMECAWYVWRPTHGTPLYTVFEPLKRPKAVSNAG